MGGKVRCPRCGNENPGDNRFCGMCGATLLAAPAIAETATQRAASAGIAVPSSPSEPVSVLRPPVEPPRPPERETRESDDAPLISGPSFLGLSDPNPRKRASLRADSRDSRSSRNLDYLLEDGPEDGGGAGKFILILVVLALAGGFGYMSWKNHGVGWLSRMLSKPAASVQAPSGSDANPPATAPANPAPEQQTPATTPTPPPATSAQPPVSDNSQPTNPSSASPATTTPANHEESKPASAANPPADAGDEDTPPENNAPPALVAKPANPKPAVETPSPKPHAAVVPAKPFDPVSEAQKYLYGRGGAAQDCDRGLRLLKPAANAANPKAMIEMGALYSAGLCTPRDLPTAYRWFAIALRKDPENEAVQRDLQKLWSEMTQPERQLAIKLTQ